MMKPVLLLSFFLIVTEKWPIAWAGTTKSPLSTIITVKQNDGANMEIVSGYHEPGVAWANLTNRQASSGWLHLDVSSNSSWSNHQQALAAGLAEGFLTADVIHEYYREYIHKPFCKPYPDFCNWVKAKFEENKAWVEAEVKDAGDDPYWGTVGLFYVQLEGVRQGWVRNSGNEPADMDPDHGIMFINFYADISDFITKYKKQKVKASLATRSFSFPSCSVLIKILPDSSDIYVGHDTWHEYSAMSFRFLKRYSLPYSMEDKGTTVPGHTTGHTTTVPGHTTGHTTTVPGHTTGHTTTVPGHTTGHTTTVPGHTTTVPGHTISMSSYAGKIFSLDDFYSLSSGLATTETTLFVYNGSLYEQVVPAHSLYEPVRAMVANRLAKDGKMWSDIFRKHNSGTYNNHWMVVDYNKVGGKEGLLWVVEQLPGQVVAKDQTSHLLQEGYWASYNRAFYKDVFKKSGAQEMVDQYGNWFSYHKNPRAAIFSRDHSSVTDIDSMFRLMRSNNFSVDPLSRVEGCSGPIPAAAIANRGDIHPSTVTCTFTKLDAMVGFRPYGAIDTKVQTSSSAGSQSFLAVAGPTTSGHPPFSWTTSGFSKSLMPSYRPIDTWDFSPEWVVWPRVLGRKIGTRSRSLPADSPEEPNSEDPNSAAGWDRLNVRMLWAVKIFIFYIYL